MVYLFIFILICGMQIKTSRRIFMITPHTNGRRIFVFSNHRHNILLNQNIPKEMKQYSDIYSISVHVWFGRRGEGVYASLACRLLDLL